jgi:hypothetical protein
MPASTDQDADHATMEKHHYKSKNQFGLYDQNLLYQTIRYGVGTQCRAKSNEDFILIHGLIILGHAPPAIQLYA